MTPGTTPFSTGTTAIDMKLFLDTGNLQEVEKASQWGFLDGVTTNPTLIAQSGKGFKETVLEICKMLPDGDISAEVVGHTYDEMKKEADLISSWADNIVVKVPMNPPGMQLVRYLSEQGIRTNVTLVFSVNQALLAAKCGATYISNFVGRVDDLGDDGMRAMAETVQMVETYGFASEVLAASIRHPQHVTQAVEAGAHVATMPFKIYEMMFKHPLTDIGFARFDSDWKSAGLKIE